MFFDVILFNLHVHVHLTINSQVFGWPNFFFAPTCQLPQSKWGLLCGSWPLSVYLKKIILIYAKCLSRLFIFFFMNMKSNIIPISKFIRIFVVTVKTILKEMLEMSRVRVKMQKIDFFTDLFNELPFNLTLSIRSPLN